jgi:hypothetical protein
MCEHLPAHPQPPSQIARLHYQGTNTPPPTCTNKRSTPIRIQVGPMQSMGRGGDGRNAVHLRATWVFTYWGADSKHQSYIYGPSSIPIPTTRPSGV